MDLANIRNDRATARCTYMGDELEFKYRPGMVTPHTYARLSTEQTVEELADFFVKALVTWDLTEKDEDSGKRKMVDITPEVFMNLPMGLVRSMTQAILQDVPQRDVGKESNDS